MEIIRWVLSVSLLAMTLVYLELFNTTEAIPIRKSLDLFPANVEAWRAIESVPLGKEEQQILKVSDYLMRRYVDPRGRSLWLYVGYWETQRKGAQAHSPKNCLPGGGWEPLEASRLRVPIPARGSAIELNRYVLQKGSDRQIVLYWFESQGRPVASEFEAKLELVRGSILRHRSDGAVVRVSGIVADGVDETSDSLVKYIQAMYPMLNGFLPS